MEKTWIDPSTGIEITPSIRGRKCAGRDICCEECDGYLHCFPEPWHPEYQQILREWEEEFFTDGMALVAEEEGRKGLEGLKRLQADPEYDIPEEVRQRHLDAIARAFGDHR